MAVNVNQALGAYQRALGGTTPGVGGGAGAATSNEGGSFANVLRDTAEAARQTLQSAESQSLKAAVGEADMNDVVLAVSKAEMTLQTVVTVRDRAIQAYQDILRMPI